MKQIVNINLMRIKLFIQLYIFILQVYSFFFFFQRSSWVRTWRWLQKALLLLITFNYVIKLKPLYNGYKENQLITVQWQIAVKIKNAHRYFRHIEKKCLDAQNNFISKALLILIYPLSMRKLFIITLLLHLKKQKQNYL